MALQKMHEFNQNTLQISMVLIHDATTPGYWGVPYIYIYIDMKKVKALKTEAENAEMAPRDIQTLQDHLDGADKSLASLHIGLRT